MAFEIDNSDSGHGALPSARGALRVCGPRLCPPYGCEDLALRELEAAASLGAAVLLALDHARVAGEEAAALERAAQVRLIGHQRLRQAVTHGARLSRQAAAGDRADDVVLAVAVG